MRPVEPLSGLQVNSHRPRFRWRLTDGVQGALVQVCADRACESVEWEQRAEGDRARLGTVLGPGVHWWRLHPIRNDVVDANTGPTWEFFVTEVDLPLPSAWNTVPDFDNDGRPDSVGGSEPGGDPSWGGWQEEVRYGRPDGAAPRTSLLLGPEPYQSVIVGPIGGASFQRHESRLETIRPVGDLDGDGFGDVLVVRRRNDAYGVGWWTARHLLMYRGGPDGLAAQGAILLEVPLPTGFWPLGDHDGDGYADVEATYGVDTIESPIPSSATVYGGPTSPTLLAGGIWAHASSVYVGDFDADGIADVVRQSEPRADITTLPAVRMGIEGARRVALTEIPPCDGVEPTRSQAPIIRVEDIDRDGYSDLTYEDDRSGRWTYRGGPAGLDGGRCTMAPGR